MSTQFQHPELPISPFEAGVRLYDEPKPEGERDLVTEVRSILVEAGIPEEVVAGTFDKSRHVTAAKDRLAIVQRTHLNQFICLSLQTTPKDTIQMRAELLPNGATDDWAKHIKEVVAPFIAEQKLLG